MLSWTGWYVAIGDIDFLPWATINLFGLGSPLDSYESGGGLFQETSLQIRGGLVVKKAKCMLDNCGVVDETIVEGPSMIIIKNCKKYKSLTSTGKIECRIAGSDFKEFIKMEKASGEIIETTVKDATIIDSSGLILRNNSFKDTLDVKNSYVEGSQLKVENDLTLSKNFMILYDVTTNQNLGMTENYLYGGKIGAAKDCADSSSYIFASNLMVKEGLMMSGTYMFGAGISVDKDMVVDKVSFFLENATVKGQLLSSSSYIFASTLNISKEITDSLSSYFVTNVLTESNLVLSNTDIVGSGFSIKGDAVFSKTNAYVSSVHIVNNFSVSSTSVVFGSKVQVEQSGAISSSVLYASLFDVGKKIGVDQSTVIGGMITSAGDTLFNSSTMIGAGLSVDKLLLSGSNMFASAVSSIGGVDLNTSFANLEMLTADEVTLVSSSLTAQGAMSKTGPMTVNVDSSSAFLGSIYGGTVHSSGAVFLTQSGSRVEVNGKAFIGIGVTGSSNMPSPQGSLKGGVDILSDPRINNRSRADFIANVAENIYFDAGSNIESIAGAKIISSALQSMTLTANATLVTFAGTNSYTLAGRDLLCSAVRDMEIVTSHTILISSGLLWCNAICSFTASDHCTASGGLGGTPCYKPVWLDGGKDPTMIPPTIPGIAVPG